MDPEKVKGQKAQDPLQEDNSSSNIDPIEQGPYQEEPQIYSKDHYHNDLEKNQSDNDHLSKVISNPDNVRRLESLTRVLSSRRLSVRGLAAGPLQIDPNDFDLNALLKSMAQRLDDQGIARKYTGVALDNVTVWGKDISTAHGPSVTEFVLNLLSFPKTIFSVFKKKTRPIIRDVTGLIREGELLLVLGRPGSGCTTFLKTVAGEISQFTKIDGEVTYSGASQEEMLKTFKSEVIYNAECKYFL